MLSRSTEQIYSSRRRSKTSTLKCMYVYSNSSDHLVQHQGSRINSTTLTIQVFSTAFMFTDDLGDINNQAGRIDGQRFTH